MQQKKWSKEAEEYLLTLMSSSWTDKEIAEKINKRFGTAYTKSAVTGKKRTMSGKEY